MSFPVGAHLAVSRGTYTHHGVYVGHERVIHYSGEVARKADAHVCEVSLAEFANGGRVHVVTVPDVSRADAIVQRARSRMGERRYSLVTNNCEHFSRWCCERSHRSAQVERVGDHLTERLARLLTRVITRII